MTERFELLEPAGRGAMGVVWRARDTVSGALVAVKLLRGIHVDDPEYVERFAREVELARRVRSPHVVRVLGYGARDSVPFVVLEYVSGRSLRERLAERGPYDPTDARSVIAQVASGLAAVHACGIVHRDVKGSNVLVTDDGLAKLTDFGIARASDANSRTGIGTLLGTPAYLAPEGARDARSDLYSLGVLYYELLTGVLPFAGTSYQEVILAHVRQPPDLGRVPPSERELAGWLLAKDPSRRPQRAEELLARLGASPSADSASPSPTFRPARPGGSVGARGGSSGGPASRQDPPPASGHASDRSSTAILLIVATVATVAIFLIVNGASGHGAVTGSPVPSGSDFPVTSPVLVSVTSITVLVALGVIAAIAMALTLVLGTRRSRRQGHRPAAGQRGRAP